MSLFLQLLFSEGIGEFPGSLVLSPFRGKPRSSLIGSTNMAMKMRELWKSDVIKSWTGTPDGAAPVDWPQPGNATMPNAVATKTIDFTGEGEVITASEPKNSVNESKPKSPVPVDYGRANGGVEYRRKNGDKWESVAAQFGVGVHTLIYSNFKTRVPEEVNWYLRNHTGCNQPSPSGLIEFQLQRQSGDHLHSSKGQENEQRQKKDENQGGHKN